MGRRLVFKIAVVLMAGLVAYFWLRDRTPRLVDPISRSDANVLSDQITGLHVATYDRFDAPLWNDRSYHTFQFSQRLKGLAWVPVGRNEQRPYVLEVKVRSALFTLANRQDPRGVREWMILPDTILVDDVYAPRRFDQLLSLDVDPGIYVVRSPEGGPSRPVFFDPERVVLLQR